MSVAHPYVGGMVVLLALLLLADWLQTKWPRPPAVHAQILEQDWINMQTAVLHLLRKADVKPIDLAHFRLNLNEGGAA